MLCSAPRPTHARELREVGRDRAVSSPATTSGRGGTGDPRAREHATQRVGAVYRSIGGHKVTARVRRARRWAAYSLSADHSSLTPVASGDWNVAADVTSDGSVLVTKHAAMRIMAASGARSINLVSHLDLAPGEVRRGKSQAIRPEAAVIAARHGTTLRGYNAKFTSFESRRSTIKSALKAAAPVNARAARLLASNNF